MDKGLMVSDISKRVLWSIKTKAKALPSFMKETFRNLSLKTQLLLILLFLLVISISSLMIIIYTKSEEQLIEKITDNIDDITKAIQISVEEMTYQGSTTERLKSYVEMLNKKGIKEISILSNTSEVIASSDPKKIGTKARLEGKRLTRKKDLIITARLGDEAKTRPQRPYNVIMPVSVKGQNLGYVHIRMVMDDYELIQKKNHIKRILSTIFAFGIGIIFSLLIAEKYTEPIKRVAQASRRIAEGQLVKIREKNRKDEIGILIKSFNEMVDRLAERKELEERLKKSEQLSIIGQLSSGIAHEIRNPLNFLSLSVGHIKERIKEGEIEPKGELLQLLDNITTEIYRMNALINNFLLLGKPIILKKEWVSSRELIEEAVRMLKDKARDGIEIKTVYKEDGLSLYCDREYMRLSLINLILNAIQAIDGEEGLIKIECGMEPPFFYLTISDNGSGIPPNDIERIFEPYYTTKKLGIGLGLTVAKRFIEEHGGRITIKSEQGKGTDIKIEVPNYEA